VASGGARVTFSAASGHHKHASNKKTTDFARQILHSYPSINFPSGAKPSQIAHNYCQSRGIGKLKTTREIPLARSLVPCGRFPAWLQSFAEYRQRTQGEDLQKHQGPLVLPEALDF
jgi:hypothetical protein